MTRVADRVNEQTLLDQSLVHTASQLERLIRSYRKTDGSGRAQQDRRRARWFWEDDGMLVISARLPSDEGAILVAALEQAQLENTSTAQQPTAESADPQTTDARTRPAQMVHRDDGSEKPMRTDEGERPPAPPMDAADALLAVARNSLAAGQIDSSGDDRHLVVVHVDAEILTQDDPPDSARCHLEDGPGIDRQTSMRITCDAALVALIKSAVPGEKLMLGRKTRKISPALRRALRFRDGCCQHPGCTRTRQLEAHHVVHWAKGGPTNLNNLVLLCRLHHMSIHEDGFTVRRAPTSNPSASAPPPSIWQFFRPDGTLVPGNGVLDGLATPGAGDGLDPAAVVDGDPDALRPGWRGEEFSLADSVAVLCAASR